jgi:hypothetical protein
MQEYNPVKKRTYPNQIQSNPPQKSIDPSKNRTQSKKDNKHHFS